MKYTNSPLVQYTRISPNKTSPRNHVIDTVTIHCMAGNLSVEKCGSVFAPAARRASSNYGIGSDGRIAMYVEEKDRSWCSSSAANDNRAVTIEVANDGGSDTGWHVSDKAMESLISLAADICRRNGIRRLVWSTDKTSRVRHLNGCNMTVHRDFAAKACPGDYLYSRHFYIADQVNQRIGSSPDTSACPSPSPKLKYIFDNRDYSRVFNPDFYADKYPDLKQALGTDPDRLFRHFCTWGMREGRIACADFDVNKYREYHEDLRRAYGGDLPLYYRHYIIYGYYENRKCT